MAAWGPQRVTAAWSWWGQSRRRTRWMVVAWSALFLANVVGLVVDDQWSGWLWALCSALMIGVHIDAERSYRRRQAAAEAAHPDQPPRGHDGLRRPPDPGGAEDLPHCS